MDIDYQHNDVFIPRRSLRLIEKQKQDNQNISSNIVTKNKVVKKIKKTNVIKHYSIRSIKINDLFYLIKKNHISESDKKVKYSLIEIILKHRKIFGLSNNVISLYKKRNNVFHILTRYCEYSIIDITEHFNEIFQYPELYRLETTSRKTNNEINKLTKTLTNISITCDIRSESKDIIDDINCLFLNLCM